jgi:hypothetical protein
METTKRKINYFELIPKLKGKSVLSADFIKIFTRINKTSKDKAKGRYIQINDRMVYITDLKFLNEAKKITGKIFNIRMDVFPELINTESDKLRDIEATDKEGIVEITHFVLSYSKDPIILCFEYNHYGPRISDFIYYIDIFGAKEKVSDKCDFFALTRDDLKNYKSRMHRFSFFLAKVHKDNVLRLNEIDSELFSAISTANSISDAEYVTLSLKYDYANSPSTSKIKTIVNKLIDKLVTDKKYLNVFDTLKVKAEDANNNDKLKEFDLLNIWIQTEVKVQKREKSRSIMSTDLFDKMMTSLYKEFTR